MLANIKMDRQRWPEKLLIWRRSGTQYVAMVTELLSSCCGAHLVESFMGQIFLNRPFSKMAAENLNKSKLKTNTSTRKSILNLVTLPSFSISVEIQLRKCKLKIVKFTDVCMTGGIMHTPSHTNVCKFFNCQHTFSQLIFHLKCWNLAGLLNLRCFF